MRLKRLELFGFKSFADRTMFEFHSDTLTGIVGPNGCGKSNVVDAVRWVLGEQRPTSMRGSEMTDVIFKGSTSRAALGVAEVTLTLDNGTGVLDGRGPEVQITRRVFKSGEGEYAVDGDTVRLKDVREMLFDTGLGSRGYSVLEQGRIDAVLSANPLERRRIFEEAAGISRYRQRKVEAELRLKRVADDMTRLDDVIGELASRVRSLKIQAGKAERFVEAREQWSTLRARYFRHRAWLLDHEILASNERLAELESRAASERESRARAEHDVQSLAREGASLEAEVERLSKEASQLSGDGRALDERRSQLMNRVAAARESAERESARKVELASILEEREAEYLRATSVLARLEGERQRTHGAATEAREAARTIDEKFRAARTDSARENEKALGLFYKKNQLESRIGALAEAEKPASERRSRLDERLVLAREGVAAKEREVADAAARASEEARAFTEEEGLQQGRTETLARLDSEVAAADSERSELELERAKVQGRIEFLRDRERDFEELSAAARDAVEEVERGDVPFASELSGWMADHLRTDTRHARALDAVLGQRAQALVAKDSAAAARISGWLKARGGGQLWLVVQDALEAHPPVSDVGDPLEGDVASDVPEVIGRLRDAVRCTRGFERLADVLCAHVYVVRDVESALALCARRPRVACVTLEGELCEGALLWSGSRALTQGAVGRRSSAAELELEVARLDCSIAELDARRVARARDVAELEAERDCASVALDVRRRERARAEADLAGARSRLSDLLAAERALAGDRQAAEKERGEIEREVETARSELARVSDEHALASERLDELERAAKALEAEREAVSEREAQCEVEATRVKTELEGLAARAADLARTCDEKRAEVVRSERLAREHAEAAERGARECEELAIASADILTRRADVESRLVELRRRVERGRESVDAARAKAEAATRELEDGQARIAGLQLEVQRGELARSEVGRRAEEELALSTDDLARDFELDPELATNERLDALDLEVKELKQKLDKLGPVNMEAMSELSEVGARHEFLETQRKDLARSRDALNAAVQTIDAESKRLFLESFETVRANFQRIFRQLFGGGRADVELEAGVDPLDAGVDIVARPPGRELLSIGLLSGGQRTLTALALLFAVFQSRPSPFCILDEVDAALDDANVDRFLGMLDGFRSHTQFVVVTHNKGTMAACQSLYGVTMETKGVSRHVSVHVSDAEQWTESAAVTSESNGNAVRPSEKVAARAATLEHGAVVHAASSHEESSHEESGNGSSTNGASAGGASAHAESTHGSSARPELDRDTGEPVVELVPVANEHAAPRRASRARRAARSAPRVDDAPSGAFDSGAAIGSGGETFERPSPGSDPELALATHVAERPATDTRSPRPIEAGLVDQPVIASAGPVELEPSRASDPALEDGVG